MWDHLDRHFRHHGSVPQNLLHFLGHKFLSPSTNPFPHKTAIWRRDICFPSPKCSFSYKKKLFRILKVVPYEVRKASGKGLPWLFAKQV
ncbi:hypothetical protein NPIL_554321 [Nephila pilipes]|uniref:Uncharacterized protein n=1 Tax=Nephila pilipes TaxID=299642 RepID=A0A8X6I7M2_NEPPI|nr:hypothetical protein NPIL_554321 [Nephila pilipes]